MVAPRWVRPSNRDRNTEGYYETEFHRMRQRDPEYFKDSIRMSPRMFDLLLNKIEHRLDKKILPQADITQLYLAHGTPVSILSRLFKMGEFTVRSITLEVCQVLWDTLKLEYLPVPTEQDWKKYAEEYTEKWNFPNCCGAVDGKHVAIQCPANSGSVYFNHKGFHSIVLMAVCNAKYEFLMVDIGGFGGNSDGGLFSASEFGKRLLQNPPPNYLPNSVLEFPFYIVGDAAFPLKRNLMRPYPDMNLPIIKENFNTRPSIARRTIENAFGILVARWRILSKTIDLHPTNTGKITQACVILHNFMIRHTNDYNSERFVGQVNRNTGTVTSEGEWRPHTDPLWSVTAAEVYLGNNSSRNAYHLRDVLAQYVLDE
ncbi:uncharacterized protein LOC129738243 [Uranotaenia lowii]|uniref:uncharacterized protein LOC129738243 n=1 Tax=Uranotaenia lowii TaxID=190385 RepID=UPI00247A38C4|nr:uncharacterized protein LOC129738243 [Uranotaenia lowii]